MERSIFQDLKIAEFTSAVAGPLASRILAALGATVVKVESHKYPDGVRGVVPFKDEIPGVDRSAQFAFYNFSKYGLTLDLKNPAGLSIAERLIKWADVVIENLSPGKMDRIGLGYKQCSQMKPDIIYLSSTSLGRGGPLSSYGAWGYHHGPLAGFSHLVGWPDRMSCADNIAYTDSLAPVFSAIAIVGALLHRRRTGRGVHIDQSQTEAGINFLGPTMLNYLVNGEVEARQGNRDPHMAPHGIFPCREKETWVAITIADDAQWKKFCLALDHEEWCHDERFSSLIVRKKHEDTLEKMISEWTICHSREEITTLLQSEGIPAGMVSTAEELFKDPQLKHRSHFGTLNHAVIGDYTYELPPYRFSKMPPPAQRPAPLLGEHNEYVLKDILGYSDDDISDFIINGAVTTDADLD